MKPANELAEWVEASAGMGTALGTAAYEQRRRAGQGGREGVTKQKRDYCTLWSSCSAPYVAKSVGLITDSQIRENLAGAPL